MPCFSVARDHFESMGTELTQFEPLDLSRMGSARPEQFVGGMKVPLSAALFLVRHKGLWPLAAVPAAISFGLFVVLGVFLLWTVGPLLESMWAKPDGLFVLLWWTLKILMYPLAIIALYFLTLMISAIVASPANDALAARVEALAGQTVPPHEGVDVRGALRGALQAAANLLISGAIMVPLVLLNLIPVAGGIAATVLGWLVASFFVALDYTDWTLERRQFGWRSKWKAVWENRWLALGFGLGASFLMWIPIVNFLCMPIAVIGGTSLALEIDRRKHLDS